MQRLLQIVNELTNINMINDQYIENFISVTYPPWCLANFMALSMRSWYAGMLAAAAIRDGLVVASVGLNSFIAVNWHDQIGTEL